MQYIYANLNLYWAKGSVSFLGICSCVPMTLLILSEGLSSFEMWGNHSEEFMCVHPGWNFHYKKWGVDVSTNPKKSCLDYSNYQILQITFRRNKKTPLISRETPELFFAASKKPPPKKTPRVSRYFASYKKKSVRLPMVASRGKNWWERENPPLGMEGPDEIINPMNTPEN